MCGRRQWPTSGAEWGQLVDDARVQVTGLADLQKALRQVDKDLPKELAGGLAEVSQIVVDEARPHIPVRSGKAAGSMKIRKQQRGASIALGGNAAPYMPWLEFGGTVGKSNSIKRPFVHAGRYTYPALRRKDAEVKAKLDEVLERMAKAAGFETEGDAARG